MTDWDNIRQRNIWVSEQFPLQFDFLLDQNISGERCPCCGCRCPVSWRHLAIDSHGIDNKQRKFVFPAGNDSSYMCQLSVGKGYACYLNVFVLQFCPLRVTLMTNQWESFHRAHWRCRALVDPWHHQYLGTSWTRISHRKSRHFGDVRGLPDFVAYIYCSCKWKEDE